MHNPIPSNGPNSNNHYHTNDIANHTPAIGQAYGNPNRSSGINHFRPVAATDRTRRDQFASYLSGYDSGAQGSGYKHPVTTPSRGVCLVGGGYFGSDLTLLRPLRIGSSATQTLNIPIQILGRCLPTARMPVRSRPRPRLRPIQDS